MVGKKSVETLKIYKIWENKRNKKRFTRVTVLGRGNIFKAKKELMKNSLYMVLV